MEEQIKLLIELAKEYAEFGLSLKMRDHNHFDSNKNADSWDCIADIYINSPDQICIKLGGVSWWVKSNEITIPVNSTATSIRCDLLRCRVLLIDLKTDRFEEIKAKQEALNASEICKLKAKLKQLEG